MKNYLIGLKSSTHILVFLGGSDGKESACNAGDTRLNTGLESYSEREWLLTPVFLSGEFHGETWWTGYSPWSCKESDMTEQLTLTFLSYCPFCVMMK